MNIESEELNSFTKVFPLNPFKYGIRHSVDSSGLKRYKTFEGREPTLKLIEAHLTGRSKPIGYLAGSHLATTVGVIDLDAKNFKEPGSLDDARLRAIELAEDIGIQPFLERSIRSGWHVYVFSDAPLPYAVMRQALKTLANRAGLGKVEVFPKGDDAEGSWYSMPYAGAASDHRRLGETYLTTSDEQPIPYDELEDTIEFSPARILIDLADEYKDDAPQITRSGSANLPPEKIETLKQLSLNPPDTFARHDSLIAFINLSRRCDQEREMIEYLKSDDVYRAWVKDKSRTKLEWDKEIDRWQAAQASNHERGFPFLRQEGFPVPKLTQRQRLKRHGFLGRNQKQPKNALDDSFQKRKQLPLTDVGNSERLVQHHGEEIRYCPATGWYIFDGKRWKSDELGRITELAKETVRCIYAEAAKVANDRERKELDDHARHSESASRIKAMIELAKSSPSIAVSIDAFDNNPYLLNVLNGTIDLQTCTLKPHDKADLITNLAQVPYDPSALCPTFDKFQIDICGGDASLIAFKKRLFGYMLSGDAREQAFFVAYGTGANGKSTEIDVIQALMGSYSKQASIDTFLTRITGSANNDIARLSAARFVVAVEADSGRKLAESLIKQLTGNDTITARFLYKEPFEFKANFKILLATNHKPEIKGTDEGIWRRVKLIPYNVTIPEKQRDQDLSNKLKKELSGVLNWMLKGFQDWQRMGLSEPLAVQTATADYRAETDMLSGFLNECCLIASSYSVMNQDIYTRYAAWCEMNGENVGSKKQLSQMLKERGFQQRKSGSIRTWSGLTLKAEEQDG